MGVKILAMGDPGTGKTTALETLDPKKVFYISGDGKGLPFPNWKKKYKTVYKENGKLDLENSNYFETNNFDMLLTLIKAVNEKRTDIEVIVVDTITSFMEEDFMSRIKEKGFEKYDDGASHIYKILNIKENSLRDNLSLVLLAHTDDNYDSDGVLKTSFKVIGGRIMRDKIVAESKFNYVFNTEVIVENDTPKYYFLTQNNGKKTSRTPKGVFEDLRIPNDFKYILQKVKEHEEG
jgi:hypothetical protein